MTWDDERRAEWRADVTRIRRLMAIEKPASMFGIEVPVWIEQGILLTTIDQIAEKGCDSGAYMPAVAGAEARETMAEWGDSVIGFLEETGLHDDLEVRPVELGWREACCKILATAVDTWAGQVAADLSEVELEWSSHGEAIDARNGCSVEIETAEGFGVDWTRRTVRHVYARARGFCEAHVHIEADGETVESFSTGGGWLGRYDMQKVPMPDPDVIIPEPPLRGLLAEEEIEQTARFLLAKYGHGPLGWEHARCQIGDVRGKERAEKYASEIVRELTPFSTVGVCLAIARAIMHMVNPHGVQHEPK